MVIKSKTNRNPKHMRLVKPFNRQKTNKYLTNIVDETYLTQEQQEEHPLLFCAGLEYCFYAAQDCLYKKKRCYFE